MRIKPITISENVQKLMERDNLTEENFAASMGYTVMDVKRFLSGELLFNPTQLRRVAEFFGVQFKDLLY